MSDNTFHRICFVVVMASLGMIVMAQSPVLRDANSFDDLRQTNEVVIQAKVSSVLVTNYHLVHEWTNGEFRSRTVFSSILPTPSEPLDNDGNQFEGLKRQSIREVKEIPTLRFSWMGKWHEVVETNVLESVTNREVMRYFPNEQQWRWTTENDNSRFPPR